MKIWLITAGAAVLVISLAVGMALAGVTARHPITPPLFSIDPNSPRVAQGFSSADVLLPFDPNIPVDPNRPNGPGFPSLVFRPHGLLLTRPDNIDALSLPNLGVAAADTFVLVFSVNRHSVGAVGPDPFLVSLGFPFNVQDQASKGQASGDAFMSLQLFNGFGVVPAIENGIAANNTLMINQGDAGGVDYSLTPDVSPVTPLAPGTPTGGVNAGAGSGGAAFILGNGGPLARPIPEVILFSLQRNSPSLPPTLSGAAIFVDVNPTAAGGEFLYAQGIQLGLQPDDDIDGMIVFDDGDLQFLDPTDRVIFSLTPNSPSLGGPAGPADLFIAQPGAGFGLYASADALGLLPGLPPDPNAPLDNIDMLDYAACADVLACVNDWAIGFVNCPGDVDGDGDADLTDLSITLASFGACKGSPDYNPRADFTHSGCVGLEDLAIMLGAFGSFCE